MNRWTRHQVAADQLGDNFNLFPSLRSVFLPGIQKWTNDCRWSELCVGIFRTTHWSSATTPILRLCIQQTFCASDEVLGNRHQTRLNPNCQLSCSDLGFSCQQLVPYSWKQSQRNRVYRIPIRYGGRKGGTIQLLFCVALAGNPFCDREFAGKSYFGHDREQAVIDQVNNWLKHSICSWHMHFTKRFLLESGNDWTENRTKTINSYFHRIQKKYDRIILYLLSGLKLNRETWLLLICCYICYSRQ